MPEVMEKKISDRDKLILIEIPARIAARNLRNLADCFPGITDDAQAKMHNCASWIEGVLDEEDAYMPWCSADARATIEAAAKENQRG